MSKDYDITEADTEGITDDRELEYLSQIIITRNDNIPLAMKILKRIKSDRVYTLFMRKGKLKEAIDLAFERKNK